MLFGGTVTFRSDVLSGLTNGRSQHEAFTLFTLAVGVAAALGLAVMLLELALGASERIDLARLATMGLGERSGPGWWRSRCCPQSSRRRSRLGLRVARPRALAPDIDLSAFTGSSTACRLRPTSCRSRVPISASHWSLWWRLASR